MDGFFEVQDSIVAKKITPEDGAKLMQAFKRLVENPLGMLA